MGITIVFFQRILFGILYLGTCQALRDVKVYMPAAVQRGDMAVFVCSYDLEGEALYQLKWYKGRREFYRFAPKEVPSIKIFHIPGLNVMTDRSNASQVTLDNVDMLVAGKYSCEVTADSPSFHTALVSGETNIVEIPRHTPTISGIKPKYKLGDVLRGNCTSRESKPAANLTWYINGQLANPSYVKHLRRYRSGDLETSQLSIRFMVTRQHFEHGRLKVRCTASIYTVYWKSTEKSIDEERPKLTMHNSVTPNTLGVNQLPPLYPPPPSVSFFDEDFADNTVIKGADFPDDAGVPSSSSSLRSFLSSIAVFLAMAVI